MPIGSPTTVNVLSVSDVTPSSAQILFTDNGAMHEATYQGSVIPDDKLTNSIAKVQKTRNDLREIRYNITQFTLSPSSIK